MRIYLLGGGDVSFWFDNLKKETWGVVARWGGLERRRGEAEEREKNEDREKRGGDRESC